VHGERISTPGGVWKQITGVARAFVERADGSSWLGTSDGLWRISGEHIERLSGAAGLQGDAFSSLLETSDGSLWIGYSRGLRGCVQTEGAKIMEPPRASPIPALPRCRPTVTGTCGLALTAAGFFRMTRGQIEATSYIEQFGATPVRQIYEDREGGCGLRPPPVCFVSRTTWAAASAPPRG